MQRKLEYQPSLTFKCKRCGRKLITESSQKKGYGHVCAVKEGKWLSKRRRKITTVEQRALPGIRKRKVKVKKKVQEEKPPLIEVNLLSFE